MYPKHHATISGVAVLGYGLYRGLPVPELAVWTVIGTVVGVFIDIDHFLLGATIGGRYKDAAPWLRTPFKALAQPQSFVEDVWYEQLLVHRLLSHVAVLTVLFLVRDVHPWILPAIIGLAAHIAADIVEDLRKARYWTPGFQP